MYIFLEYDFSEHLLVTDTAFFVTAFIIITKFVIDISWSTDWDVCVFQRPEVVPLHRSITPYHGPQSGGTIVVFLGVFLRKPSSVILGDRYPCWNNFSRTMCVFWDNGRLR